MPKQRLRAVSRRELLELATAAGALGFLPRVASAITPPGDEAELIGALLWAAFAKGAEINDIPEGVMKKGRDLSEGPIRKNLKDNGGLEKFPLDATVRCALCAGEKAKELAKGGQITPEIFESAWQYIHHNQRKALQRLAKRLGEKDSKTMLGGAC